MKPTVFGVDLAKHVFHVVGLNQANKVVLKKKLTRKNFLAFFHQQPLSIIAMEACGSAHHWARELQKIGHEVKLLPAKEVRPFVAGGKNDYNDATAIAEAQNRPTVYPVRIRSIEEQSMQALERFRELAVGQRTSQANQIRGLLAEFGLIVPKGLAALRRSLPEILEDAENGLTSEFRTYLNRAYLHLLELDEEVAFYQHHLKIAAKTNDATQRLMTIPGIGPVVAVALVGALGDGKQFNRGRDVSAFLGLVPRQHTTGDNPRLLSITKHGNRAVRSLLVHGARSVIRHANHKSDRLNRWASALVDRRGHNKATVALANKLARIAWAVLVKHENYRVEETVCAQS